MKIGKRSVIERVYLGFGLIGVIVPLSSATPEERADEVDEIMADAIESDYDPVPSGLMDKVKDAVGETPLKIRHPDMDRFDEAIPLRKAINRNNYIKWDSFTHDWKVCPFKRCDLRIKSTNVMIILKGSQ